MKIIPLIHRKNPKPAENAATANEKRANNAADATKNRANLGAIRCVNFLDYIVLFNNRCIIYI